MAEAPQVTINYATSILCMNRDVVRVKTILDTLRPHFGNVVKIVTFDRDGQFYDQTINQPIDFNGDVLNYAHWFVYIRYESERRFVSRWDFIRRRGILTLPTSLKLIHLYTDTRIGKPRGIQGDGILIRQGELNQELRQCVTACIAHRKNEKEIELLTRLVEGKIRNINIGGNVF